MSVKTILLLIFANYFLNIILNSLTMHGNNSHFASPYITLVLLFIIYTIFNTILTNRLYRSDGEDLSGMNIDRILSVIEKQYPGNEPMFFDVFDELSSKLKSVERKDFKSKTDELITMIENFKAKFK